MVLEGGKDGGSDDERHEHITDGHAPHEVSRGVVQLGGADDDENDERGAPEDGDCEEDVPRGLQNPHRQSIWIVRILQV